MNNDLDLIVKKYPHEWDSLRVYAIGDVHVGAPNFDERAIRKKIDIIRNDPCGVVVLCGDLGDYGLKNSKTNVYQATMQPKEQQEYIYQLFLPIADKIAAAVPGNHEERITKEVGLCPLYDLCVRWGVPEVYRENVAITKYLFGQHSNGKQQVCFVGVTTHGSSRNRHRHFMSNFSNVDFSVAGHSHTPSYSPQGRIVVNARYNVATHVPYKEIVVDANLQPGGYSLKKEYEVSPPPELQYIELSYYRENDKNRTPHKIMDYHSIQI